MEQYTFKDKTLTIIDDEIGLRHIEPFDPVCIPEDLRHNLDLGHGRFLKVAPFTDGAFEYHIAKGGILDGQCILSYPSGQTKMECYYVEGQLHGPSKFFSEAGRLLVATWFLEGRREGKSLGFYQSGAKAFIQRFRSGLWHGIQEYWYENGNLKSRMEYLNGEPDGEVLLYYSTGQLKRRLSFSKGVCVSERKA